MWIAFFCCWSEMPLLINDPFLEAELKAQRQLSGAGRWDEVWEGVYVIPPPVDDEHQDVQLGVASAVLHARPTGALVRAGVNVSDRDEDWKHNYRCPDVVAFLPGSSAKNRGAYWLGGPDFAVEIISPHDRSRDKLPFYVSVNVRELLLVDRHPWALELHVLDGTTYTLHGTSTLSAPTPLRSSVLPLSFRLVPGSLRPQIEILHHDGQQRWTA